MPTGDVIILSDGSIGVSKINRVFLLLRIKIQRGIGTGEREVALKRNVAATSPNATLPTLEVLPSGSIGRIVSRVQKKVSRDRHV